MATGSRGFRAFAMVAVLVTSAGLVSCSASPEPKSTLTVNLDNVIGPVTHVGAGGLYALATASDPDTALVKPLRLTQLTQPPPGVQQLGNGATVPTGDALKVAPSAAQIGAKIYIRMPDIYPNFPYGWVSWDDWLAKVRTMVQARLDDPSATAIDGWELWNEPDWTWETAAAGDFNDGWVRTYRAVRAIDTVTPIVGPSFSRYDSGWMAQFLTTAKTTHTIPNVISWHELADGKAGWSSIQADVDDYRELEKSLGIAPLPISINEYAAKDTIDSPSASLHFLAAFERAGVDNAGRAYWYESGTVGGLVWHDKPTGVYWLYDWYGAMTGHMVSVKAVSEQDGVASYDAKTHTARIIVGGASGDNAVRIDGVDKIGSVVEVTETGTRETGRHTELGHPAFVEKSTKRVSDGTVQITLPKQVSSSAYELIVTAH